MVGMTTTCTRPPAGLEHKSAPTMLAPRPSRPVSSRAALSRVTEVDDAGELVALVAVTGVEDDVRDVIEPGAFRSTLRERQVRGVLGHVWNRPVAQAVEVVELMPGDPRLLETKATTAVITPQRRAGAPVECSVCERPAAVVVPGGLRRGERLICPRCVEEGTDTATIDADDLIDAYQLTDPELTSEQEYDEALDNEVRYQMEPDGTLTRATDDPTRGRAWGRDQGRAWGRP